MKVIKNEYVVMVDVDDTLVMHLDKAGLKDAAKVEIFDSLDRKFVTLAINKPMVRLVREEIHRGAQVIVWSRGGYEWASNVLKALHLSGQNIIVMSKPHTYFDDKEVNDWLRYRVYLDHDIVYKQS